MYLKFKQVVSILKVQRVYLSALIFILFYFIFYFLYFIFLFFILFFISLSLQ